MLSRNGGREWLGICCADAVFDVGRASLACALGLGCALLCTGTRASLLWLAATGKASVARPSGWEARASARTGTQGSLWLRTPRARGGGGAGSRGGVGGGTSRSGAGKGPTGGLRWSKLSREGIIVGDGCCCASSAALAAPLVVVVVVGEAVRTAAATTAVPAILVVGGGASGEATLSVHTLCAGACMATSAAGDAACAAGSVA